MNLRKAVSDVHSDASFGTLRWVRALKLGGSRSMGRDCTVVEPTWYWRQTLIFKQRQADRINRLRPRGAAASGCHN